MSKGNALVVLGLAITAAGVVRSVAMGGSLAWAAVFTVAGVAIAAVGVIQARKA
ncbi:hypothetical protein ACFTSD_02675 [Nocardiaceae bacterium NPDC056970]